MTKNRLVFTTLLLTLILSMSLYGCESNNDNTLNNDTGNNSSSNMLTSDLSNAGNDLSLNEALKEEEPVEDSEVDETTVEDAVDEILDDGLPKRADIQDEYKWDLEKIYADTDAFMADVKLIEDSLDFFIDAEANFVQSYDSFFSTLESYQEIRRKTDLIYVFASLQAHTDTQNTAFSDLEDIAAATDTALNEATSYFMPEIIAMESSILTEYLAHPDMADYRIYIKEILKEKAHILSKGEEDLLAQAQILFEIPESIYDSYNYLTDLSEYLPEPDWNGFWNGSREDKRQALEAYYAKSAAGINLIAEIYESEIKKNTFFAEARHYDSALESVLAVDGMTMEAYEKVFEITHNNTEKLHRWVSLKKDILDIEDAVHIYDLYTPLIDNPYTWMQYEEGKELVYKALAPLGKQYIKDLKSGLSNRWADVYPTSGKYEGGYQWGTYDTTPFVLLNFNQMITDVSTIAHEMGHALNFKYSNQSQSYFASGVSIFNAEIASTTNESMVFEYRVKNASSTLEKQQALLNYIELIENTIFTQMIYADFEKRAYEAYEAGEPLSVDLFNGIMADVYTEYYGADFALDEMTTYQWAEIPHFYNAFYVYKYATGLSAGLAFSDMVLNGTEDDLQKYLTFLSAGSSQPPLDLLKAAGVDFSTGEPLQKAFDRFDTLLDEFEATLE